MTAPAHRLRVGVVCDYLEEGWPSMNLVAEMLLRSLSDHHAQDVVATRIRPEMIDRFRRVPLVGNHRFAVNADRLIARFVDYPARLKAPPTEDLYHIVDHSYAHLAHALPRGRTVVTCHDLDTFRSVLEPTRESRSWAFRVMTRRILTGLRRAALVTCDSVATRDEILAHRLIPRERLDVIPLGVSPEMSPVPNAAADARASALLGPARSWTELLHVGSTIPRKRIDVLLRLLAVLRVEIPTIRLIRVGGAFTPAQQDLARELGLGPAAIVVLPFLSPSELAAVYRRADAVLQPSEAEGFGLPVVEAMACGTQVVASDLPVLREVGGTAARYCPVGDITAWRTTVVQVLRESEQSAARSVRREAVLRQAATFSWTRFGHGAAEVYHRVMAQRTHAGGTA